MVAAQPACRLQQQLEVGCLRASPGAQHPGLVRLQATTPMATPTANSLGWQPSQQHMQGLGVWRVFLARRLPLCSCQSHSCTQWALLAAPCCLCPCLCRPRAPLSRSLLQRRA